MQELDGKVAVVTGAASGMGLAFAQRFAREGMRVVLGDIEQGALDAAVTALRREERDVLGVRVDVSSQESVDVLANETLDRYGAVHVLCNNAGVAAESDWSALRADGRVAGLWEHSLADWRWTFDVNFWGVVHGIRTFLPIMLEQGEAGARRQHRLHGGLHGRLGPRDLRRDEVRRGAHHRGVASAARGARRADQGLGALPGDDQHGHLPGASQPPRRAVER